MDPCLFPLQALRALLEAGADMNASFRGRTALHYAAVFGFKWIADILVEHGADTAMRDHEGRTAAETAGEFDHAALAMALTLAPTTAEVITS